MYLLLLKTFNVQPHRGFAAEKIIGMRKEGVDVSFLVKWRGMEESDFVTAKEVKAKIPQVKFPCGSSST